MPAGCYPRVASPRPALREFACNNWAAEWMERAPSRLHFSPPPPLLATRDAAPSFKWAPVTVLPSAIVSAFYPPF